MTLVDSMAGHLTYTCQSLQTLRVSFYPDSYIPGIPSGKYNSWEIANCLINQAVIEIRFIIKIRCPSFESDDCPT